MSIVIGKMKRNFVVLATTLLICSNAYAADVNLSEIEFSTANKGFNVVLKTDKNVSFKKTVQSPQKLVIEMKNTMASEDFSTIYNDVADINNVTVTPVGKDDLKIQIQGKNVNNSFVSVDSGVKTPNLVQNFDANQINLSLPIENYKPVYNDVELEDEDFEEEVGIAETIAKLNPLSGMKNEKVNHKKHKNSSGNDYKWLTYLGLAVIMFSAIRNLTKATKNAQVGLVAANLKDRERELAEKLNTGVKETLSLRSKISQSTSAPSINYGLRAYQESQKNPYENGSVPIRTIRKPEMPSSVSAPVRPQPVQNRFETKVASVSNVAPKRASRPMTTVNPYINKEPSNVDSKKFLEAMTKIYEKNGRADLAQGLRNNINKVNF